MRTLLAFHRDHCLACRNCELACSVVHSSSGRLETAISEQVPPRRRLTMAAGKDGVEAHRCEQCLEPLCAFSCKSGALSRDPASGRVVLDESRCLACYMCLMVCPFGIRPDPAADRVVRCDLCLDREIPACVEACPTGALGTDIEPDRRVQSEFEGHVVVVGSSAAGIAACEAAREHAPRCSITLVTADAHPQYSRPLLAYFLAGKIQREELAWRADGYLERDLKVRVLHALRASKLKADTRTIVLDDGTELNFDRLILATGARGIALSIPGAALDGVYALRNLDDLEGIDKRIKSGKRAVVLGGGNVGLQACEALLSRGMIVTVVVSSPYLLSQMVDAEAGRRVAELFTRNGAEVRTGCDALEIVGDGGVQGVRLNNGEVVGADLVIVGKGIRPNVEWLQERGIRIGRGIEVDKCGRTSLPDVFAAGDCAETPDPLTGKLSVSGIWPVAYEMGRAAGCTAVGVEKPSGGALRLNASRFFGESIISIGEVCPERLDGSFAQVLANRGGVYRKLVYQRGRLAGALLFGDISGAGVFYRLYREGTDLGGQFGNREIHETDLAYLVAPSILGSELTDV
jgi:nitrite reductase (NADH) large subunit